MGTLKRKNCIILILASAFQAVGIRNIHALADITEGGTLGATLLLEHWFSVSPAVSGLVLSFVCFFYAWRVLGGHFIIMSAVAGGGFSLFYAIFEHFPRLWPGLAELPLPAAILGAIFVGVGVGLCVRAGGAPTGDDALAMSLSRRLNTPIERVYLLTDLTVLALSLSYLPIERIACSVLTVILSGKIIGLIQRYEG